MVEDPAHVEKQHAREPGDLRRACESGRPVSEGAKPNGGRVRAAAGLLEKLRPDILYANSTACAEWCVAARQLGMMRPGEQPYVVGGLPRN